MPRVRSALLALVGVLAIAATPTVEGELPPRDEYEPVFVEQKAYFHAHTLPVGNLDARQGNYVQWDGNAPTSEVSAVYLGDNLGWVAQNPSGANSHAPEHFFTAEGTFTGDLENLAFDMYLHGWAQSTLGCSINLSFELIVDDEVVLWQDYAGSQGFRFDVVDDDTIRTRFALTNLWEANETFDMEYGPDVEHTVYVNIQNFYACNEFQWRYDGVEDPSSITANLPTPAKRGYFEVDVFNPPPPLEGQA